MAKRTDKARKPKPTGIRQSGPAELLDELHQWGYPREFRIALPTEVAEQAARLPTKGAKPPRARSSRVESDTLDRVIAEAATCLWHLKTRHFRKDWLDETGQDEDPRTRRALGRLQRAIAALRTGGVEIQDPTGQRYPPGSQHLMRPVEFQPTAGLTYDKVAETTVPIIFRDGRLIQHGEVFVAVPVTTTPDPSASRDSKGDQSHAPDHD